MMRRILLDHAALHQASKRGGRAVRLALTEDLCAEGAAGADVLEMDRALERLQQTRSRPARIAGVRRASGSPVSLPTGRPPPRRAWRAFRVRSQIVQDGSSTRRQHRCPI